MTNLRKSAFTVGAQPPSPATPTLFAFVYLIITVAVAHRYWEYPAAQMANQYNHFCKNLAIMGGALALYLTGAGRFSLDKWMRNR